MKSVIIAIAFLLVVAHVNSAPTEETSSTTPMTSTSSQINATDAAGANMVAAHEHLANSSFTCYNRLVGYYADPDSDCKVYHFCMLGEYNGQEVFQRVSYMCLNETVFDQQALDCVETAKAKTPCKESAKFYDESNTILRKAIIGKLNADEPKEGEPKADQEEKGDKDKDKKTDDTKDEDKERNKKDEKSDDEKDH